MFGVGGTGTDPIIYVGPSTINGSGAEFAAGDNIANSGATASGTVAAGGVATAAQRFAFSTTTAGGTYNLHINGLATLTDRTYRFDVSDSSMSGRDFKLSTTVNGEWGPDGVFGSGTPIDDGVEYTTNKTTNGTAGSSGAYVQYAFKGTIFLVSFITMMAVQELQEIIFTVVMIVPYKCLQHIHMKQCMCMM